ncbi:MAG: hypothetical protein ACLPP2_02550 [Thermoplasmata archaeon]
MTVYPPIIGSDSEKCLERAKRLRAAATILAAQDYRDVAYSLAVGAAEEFVKGFILRLVDLKLAEVGGAPRVGRVTFSNAILDKGPESHQKRWEFLADLQVAIEIYAHVKGRLKTDGATEPVDVFPIVDKAFRAPLARALQKLDPQGSLAWAVNAVYGSVPIIREVRDAGLYTVRGSTGFVDLSTTDEIEYGVVSDFLALAEQYTAPILSVDSHEERYTSDFLGVLSIVRTKRTFKIARPWDESNKWKFGLTNPFWLDKQGIVIKPADEKAESADSSTGKPEGRPS